MDVHTSTATPITNNAAKYQRTTYALGGKTVAVRDASGAVLSNIPGTGLFYLLTDHPRLRKDRLWAA